MDLSKYSIEDLRSLIKDANAEIDKRRKVNRKKTLDEIKKVAEQHGFTLAELLSPARTSKVKGRGQKAVKYRHPDDPDKGWGGQGRQPNWIKEWLASGKSLSDLAAKR